MYIELLLIDSLYHILPCFNMYWHVLTVTYTYWHVLTRTDTYWHVMTCTDMYWHILTHTDMYWYILTPRNTYRHILKTEDQILQNGSTTTTTKTSETKKRSCYERLKSHINTMHRKIMKAKCDICVKDFRSKSDLNVHIKSKHGKKEIIQCNICGKSMKTSAFSHHLSAMHINDGSGELIPKCEFCEKTISSHTTCEDVSDLTKVSKVKTLFFWITTLKCIEIWQIEKFLPGSIKITYFKCQSDTVFPIPSSWGKHTTMKFLLPTLSLFQ